MTAPTVYLVQVMWPRRVGCLFASFDQVAAEGKYADLLDASRGQDWAVRLDVVQMGEDGAVREMLDGVAAA